MKKLTLAIAAIIIGFTMTSCSNTPSAKETIIKATDEFFTQAEAKLQEITSADDFMAYFSAFENEKSEFIQNLFADYTDEEGNLKGFTEEEYNEMQTALYDRASAYNKVEAQKCAEFLTPAMDRYEKAVETLWNAYQSDEQVDEETFNSMMKEMSAAEDEVVKFAEYDNVPTELQERYTAIAEKTTEMFGE